MIVKGPYCTTPTTTTTLFSCRCSSSSFFCIVSLVSFFCVSTTLTTVVYFVDYWWSTRLTTVVNVLYYHVVVRPLLRVFLTLDEAPLHGLTDNGGLAHTGELLELRETEAVVLLMPAPRLATDGDGDP